MRHAIRHGFEIVLALGLALVLAAPVAAAKPDRSFADAGDIPVLGYCDFDVIEHPLSNNEYFSFIDDADGTTVLTGGTWILNFAGEFFMLNGRGTFRVDANGETIVSMHGQVTDLCPLLAD